MRAVLLVGVVLLAGCQKPPPPAVARTPPPTYVPVLQQPPVGATPQEIDYYRDVLAIAHMAGCGGWTTRQSDALLNAMAADPAAHHGVGAGTRFVLRTLAIDRGIKTARRTCDDDARARADALWDRQVARAKRLRQPTTRPPPAIVAPDRTGPEDTGWQPAAPEPEKPPPAQKPEMIDL
jgi:hypothetical protein